MAVIGGTPASTSITNASCMRRPAMPRGRAQPSLCLPPPAPKPADEFIGLLVADLRRFKLLRRVVLQQLVVGTVGHRAQDRRKGGVRIVEDFMLAPAEALHAG